MKRILAILAITLMPFTSFAEDSTTKIDFSAQVLNLDGKPFLDCKKIADDKKSCEREAPVLLEDIVIMSLNAVTGDLATQKTAFRVMQSISNNKSVELTSTEQKVIVDALWALRDKAAARGIVYPLAQVASAVRMINPADVK